MKLILKTIFFTAVVFAIGCKSEPAKEVDPRLSFGIVKEIQNDKIVLEDGTVKPLPTDKSVIFMVRHAETEVLPEGATKNENDNRILNETGKVRAQKLSNLLTGTDLAGVLSTSYIRAAQTAEPLAKSKNLGILSYNSTNLGRVFDFAFSYDLGKRVCVVGHSNTVPDMVRELTGQDSVIVGNIEESIHDDLFVISGTGKGNCEVQRFRY